MPNLWAQNRNHIGNCMSKKKPETTLFTIGYKKKYLSLSVQDLYFIGEYTKIGLILNKRNKRKLPNVRVKFLRHDGIAKEVAFRKSW